MAGPLSSEEIEDVVSSVRRLVSNELSPRRLSRDLGADRLILTPSLRVVSETSPLAPLVLEEKLEDPVAAPAAAAPTEEQDDHFEDAVELIEAEWEDEIWVAAEPAPLGEAALQADEAELLGAPESVDAAVVTTTDTLPEAAIEVAPLRDESNPPAGEDEGHQAPDSAEAGLAALGAAEDHPAQQSPVDNWPGTPAPETDAQAGLERDGSGAADDRDAETLDDASQRMPTEIIDADGTPLAVLDEAALQEIVRQMIREELQGDLGERITRNVRKLVRAEINRALIARDLD